MSLRLRRGSVTTGTLLPPLQAGDPPTPANTHGMWWAEDVASGSHTIWPARVGNNIVSPIEFFISENNNDLNNNQGIRSLENATSTPSPTPGSVVVVMDNATYGNGTSWGDPSPFSMTVSDGATFAGGAYFRMDVAVPLSGPAFNSYIRLQQYYDSFIDYTYISGAQENHNPRVFEISSVGGSMIPRVNNQVVSWASGTPDATKWLNGADIKFDASYTSKVGFILITNSPLDSSDRTALYSWISSFYSISGLA